MKFESKLFKMNIHIHHQKYGVLSIKRNEKITVIITIREEKARKLLERCIRVKENNLKTKNFSDSDYFGSGIEEHIEEVITSYLFIEIKYLLIQTKY